MTNDDFPRVKPSDQVADVPQEAVTPDPASDAAIPGLPDERVDEQVESDPEIDSVDEDVPGQP